MWAHKGYGVRNLERKGISTTDESKHLCACEGSTQQLGECSLKVLNHLLDMCKSLCTYGHCCVHEWTSLHS